jgi:D-3-phosphoglycerate dehydrogenase
MEILVTPASFRPDNKDPPMIKLRNFAQSRNSELVFNNKGRPLTEDELKPLLEDCEGCIAGLDFYTAGAISSASKLKVISRYGTGCDRVDIDVAKERGIAVCNTPGANAQAVAELTFALMLCLARNVHKLDRETRAGNWGRATGMELHEKNLGLVGLGAVGKAVSVIARGFGMKVTAYDPYISTKFTKENNIIISDFNTLLENSDVVCLHVPLTDSTRHIIGNEAISRMKKGTLLINTARGGLIDEEAAHEALESGQLGGLGLDAFEEEPPQKSPLFDHDNVVLTPHIGAHTHKATRNMAMMAVDNLIAVLKGEPCQYIL